MKSTCIIRGWLKNWRDALRRVLWALTDEASAERGPPKTAEIRLSKRALRILAALSLLAGFGALASTDAVASGDRHCRIIIRGNYWWGYPYYSYGWGYWYGYGHPWAEPTTREVYQPRYGPYSRYDFGSPYSPRVESYAFPTRSPATEYHQLGRDWAQDLRREIITWEKFVAYVKSFVIQASSTARDDFKKGFATGYGVNAEEAIAKAFTQASAPAANKVESAPE
jgi:hypothetical protein